MFNRVFLFICCHVSGGFDRNGFVTDTILRYNPATPEGVWIEAGQMQVGRSRHAVTVVNIEDVREDCLDRTIVKLRERDRQGVDPVRSLKGHYRWWMVDILSLMIYTKFGCHPPS